MLTVVSLASPLLTRHISQFATSMICSIKRGELLAFDYCLVRNRLVNQNDLLAFCIQYCISLERWFLLLSLCKKTFVVQKKQPEYCSSFSFQGFDQIAFLTKALHVWDGSYNYWAIKSLNGCTLCQCILIIAHGRAAWNNHQLMKKIITTNFILMKRIINAVKAHDSSRDVCPGTVDWRSFPITRYFRSRDPRSLEYCRWR